MAFRPVVFYMLDKFCVPGGLGLVAVLPVDNKLRDQGAGKIRVDVGHAQDVEDIFRGKPVIGNPFGFRAVLHRGGVLGPLDADVLDEA